MGNFVRHGDTVLIEASLFAGDCEFVTCTVGSQSVKVKPEQVHPYKPRPKHDPCRKFRSGDVVRVVERDGRKVIGFPREFIQAGDVVTVAEDEDLLHVDVFTANGRRMSVVWFCLELVSPVEELEPYKLIDSPNTYNIVRDSAMVMTIHKKSHPNAKATAEAECKRLNDEWQTKVCCSEEGKEEA